MKIFFDTIVFACELCIISIVIIVGSVFLVIGPALIVGSLTVGLSDMFIYLLITLAYIFEICLLGSIAFQYDEYNKKKE